MAWLFRYKPFGGIKAMQQDFRWSVGMFALALWDRAEGSHFGA